jgi:hypothetical protein
MYIAVIQSVRKRMVRFHLLIRKNKTLIKYLVYLYVVQIKNVLLVHFDVRFIVSYLKEKIEASVRSITPDILQLVWTETECQWTIVQLTERTLECSNKTFLSCTTWQ